jgi:putative ABC transport system permease protein
METGSIKVKYLYTTTDICMSTLRRGARNVFRNPIRTIAVVAILGISLGMIVVMMTARRAVEQRITEVKANIGNTITISPAGARGFLGGGEALTTAQLTAVSAISHVTRVDAIIDAQLGSSDTNLQSGIEAGSLGGRGFRAFRTSGESTTGSSQPPANFTPRYGKGAKNGESVSKSILSSGQFAITFINSCCAPGLSFLGGKVIIPVNPR